MIARILEQTIQEKLGQGKAITSHYNNGTSPSWENHFAKTDVYRQQRYSLAERR